MRNRLSVLRSALRLVLASSAVAATVAAQAQFAEVGWRLPPHGGSTEAVACCDLDGDGQLDLFFGNNRAPGEANQLLLNRGGSFFDLSATRLPGIAEATWDVACFDMDGDGDADLVCANGNFPGQRNRLLENDGAGFFTDVTAGRLPMDADDSRTVICCDVDGDGDEDLVFGNVGQNRLYDNDGAGVHRCDGDAHVGRQP
jgi:hypothetical protein